MSLSVWLPLDGDLHNQGVSGSTATLMGTGITWTAGKIGQAATFPNSCASCIHLLGLKLQILSWACWFKCTGEGSGSSQRLLSEGRDTGSVGTNIWVSKAGTTLYWSAHKVTGSTAISLNTWYHVVLTCDGSKVHLYLNGEEKGTGTAYSEDSDYAQSNDTFVIGKMAYSYTNTSNYFPFCGQINDVRIYNHALSTAEVREIAQGLILHYKLDGGLFGNPNLALDTNTSTNRWNLSMQTGDKTNSIEYEGGTPISVITRGSTAQSGWRFLGYSTIDRSAIKTATDYTVSFDIYASVGGTIGFTGLVQSNAQNYLTASTSIVQNTVIANQWNHIILQCHTKDSFEGISVSSQIIYLAPSNNFYNVGAILKFKNMKFEEGLAVTPWCPADSEMNIDRTIIEDSSGYNHNGTIVGTAVPATDTARYNTSTHIDGAGVITAATPGADIRTLSCWVKTTKNKSTSQMLVADSGSNMCISFYSGTIIGVFGTTRSTGSKCTLGTSYKENDWNHIVVVKTSDDGQRNIYCNGEKLTPAANDFWSATAGFFVGNRNGTGSGNTPFFGYISDVRAYCTPLLDTDIKQLYNVGMKIDNYNNLMPFMLNEINAKNEHKIMKTGQLKCGLVTENAAIKQLKYDNNIYVEPDGSLWVRVFHHNNPGAGSFSSTNDFVHDVYIDENRWFNVSVCSDGIQSWELMIKGKDTETSQEYKRRWIQYTSPMSATFNDVAAQNIVKITTEGYVAGQSAWGGLYAKKGGAYLTANNGNSGNWWGAVGSYSVYQGGIPGWSPTGAITTTGYNDLYFRIDDHPNVSRLVTKACYNQNKIWIAQQLIER